MTEAVIVVDRPHARSGARSRARSRTSAPTTCRCRSSRAALAKIPELDPTLVDDLYWGCAEPSGRQGPTWPASSPCWPATTGCPGSTINRFCASSRADHPDGLPRDQGRRGRHLRLRRRRVRVAVPQLGRRRRRRRTTPRTPLFGEPTARSESRPPRATRPGPTRASRACCPTSTSPWARPPRTSRRLRGISRERQDEWGVSSQNRAEKAIANGFFEREITPVTLPRRHASSATTTAPAPA